MRSSRVGIVSGAGGASKFKFIGTARAISDGVRSSAVYDMVVHPDYQSQGVGRRVMSDLLARLPGRSVMLVSLPAQCAFYEKPGFRRLKTAMAKHEEPAVFIESGCME